MKYLLLLVLLAGCTKTVIVEKEIEIVKPKFEELCVKIASYTAYPILGDRQEDLSQRVRLVVKATSTNSQSSTEILNNGMLRKYYGYYISVYNSDTLCTDCHWLRADVVERLEKVSCFDFGNVYQEKAEK